jgi:ubiquinone/menaquinone biosynthesis C-methylase UbiE
MVKQRHLDDAQYFKFLGSLVTNDTRFTSEIKSSIFMATTKFKIKKNIFTRKFNLIFWKNAVNIYTGGIGVNGAETLEH